jgi:hypothetical protein
MHGGELDPEFENRDSISSMVWMDGDDHFRGSKRSRASKRTLESFSVSLGESNGDDGAWRDLHGCLLAYIFIGDFGFVLLCALRSISFAHLWL